MANPAHLQKLREGVTAWNAWRKANSRGKRKITPDLSAAQLSGENLRRFDLTRANLWKAKLAKANLRAADLSYAQMSEADFSGADLSGSQVKYAILSRATLIGTTLRGADLRGTSLRRAILRGANLTGANLRHASLAEADLEGAKLKGVEVYGAGIWGLKGKPADESGLIIQADFESPPLTVDDLESAQLLFVLLDNPKIAEVIDTLSSRTVLILGRFTPARKLVLDAIKTRLIAHNFVPLLFDFAKPRTRDLTETVASLAHMACFIIADLTDAKSIPHELSFIVPYLPSVPVLPLIGDDERPYAMFEHFTRYRWVQPAVKYRSLDHLLSIFDDQVLKVGFCESMRSRGIRHPRLPTPAKKRIVRPSSGRQP